MFQELVKQFCQLRLESFRSSDSDWKTDIRNSNSNNSDSLHSHVVFMLTTFSLQHECKDAPRVGNLDVNIRSVANEFVEHKYNTCRKLL